ncbi:uncharacterized protein G2W53_025448 [Senna tora]|uniref:Uncharacterized protein n=1 Tax=Senna tora TaxID=362788 RepID=A0A834WGH4_9FABA|nr:uncharacterized protein G2W53_025448 [Senna tora]
MEMSIFTKEKLEVIRKMISGQIGNSNEKVTGTRTIAESG